MITVESKVFQKIGDEAIRDKEFRVKPPLERLSSFVVNATIFSYLIEADEAEKLVNLQISKSCIHYYFKHHD